MKHIFLPTNCLKILSFFALHPDQVFYERELSRLTGVSTGSTNKVLNALFKEKYLDRRSAGKTLLYTLNDSIPAVRQFKILNILVLLEGIIEPVQELSKKVVLYGSFSRGENTKESDVDLFVISNKKDEIREILGAYLGDDGKEGIKIQLIIRSSAEWMALEEKDPVFFRELSNGIIIWDKNKHEI